MKNSTQHKKVFIHNDQKREERLLASNFRLLLNAYKRRDKNISLRGDRIITVRDQDSCDDRCEDGVDSRPWQRADSDKRPRSNSNSERSRGETRPSDRDLTRQHDNFKGDNRRQDQYNGVIAIVTMIVTLSDGHTAVGYRLQQVVGTFGVGMPKTYLTILFFDHPVFYFKSGYTRCG